MTPQRNTLVLTATVRPRLAPNLARLDPEQRLSDYRSALQKWSTCSSLHRVVFCDNSAWPLEDFRQPLSLLQARNVSVRASSFSSTADIATRGKGAGEMEILEHVFRDVSFSENELVVKVTGRIFVKNLDAILSRVEPDTFICCDFRTRLQVAGSQLFIARSSFFANYLFKQAHVIDESRGLWFEHALARAAHQAMADGMRWEMLPLTAVLEGTAGTDNRTYPPGGPRLWKRRLLHELVRRLI